MTTAITIPTINIGIDFGMIEINAGNPPIPIAGANTPFNVMNIAATAASYNRCIEREFIS